MTASVSKATDSRPNGAARSRLTVRPARRVRSVCAIAAHPGGGRLGTSRGVPFAASRGRERSWPAAVSSGRRTGASSVASKPTTSAAGARTRSARASRIPPTTRSAELSGIPVVAQRPGAVGMSGIWTTGTGASSRCLMHRRHGRSTGSVPQAPWRVRLPLADSAAPSTGRSRRLRSPQCCARFRRISTRRFGTCWARWRRERPKRGGIWRFVRRNGRPLRADDGR